MKTKRARVTAKLDGRDLAPLARVYYEFNQLKNLYRQGWLRGGVAEEQCETVAEHSLGVAVLAMLVADAWFPNLDPLKLLRMALLHDFGEIHAGDIIPHEMALEEKQARERDSLDRVFAHLPNGADYLALWEEFERGESAEARLIKEIDRLEMGLQASVYELNGAEGLDKFFASADRALATAELRELLDNVVGLRAVAGGRPAENQAAAD